MTNKYLKHLIKNIDLQRSRKLCEGMTKNNIHWCARYVIAENQNEFIIISKGGDGGIYEKRIGGLFLMADYDIHIFMLKKYRGNHIMSDFIRRGWIKRLYPKLSETTTIEQDDVNEYNKRKHLADLIGIKVR